MHRVRTPNTVLQQRYQITRPLGRGGMGAVYEARDTRLGRTVALKETLVEDEHLWRAFEREARLLASLRHPALPQVIDHFTEEKTQFLVMEFIPGENLGRRLKARGRAFTDHEVFTWCEQLLDVLEYLHSLPQPIIHRDIKPANLKLTARGEIILLDFGLAKEISNEATTAVSSLSVLGYSPHYAPLEQIQGAGGSSSSSTPQSDLYALGATLYHLLTNELPPDAIKRATASLSGAPDPLIPIRQLTPTTPVTFAHLIEQSLELNPHSRPSSAAEMRLSLSLLDTPHLLTLPEKNDGRHDHQRDTATNSTTTSPPLLATNHSSNRSNISTTCDEEDEVETIVRARDQLPPAHQTRPPQNRRVPDWGRQPPKATSAQKQWTDNNKHGRWWTPQQPRRPQPRQGPQLPLTTASSSCWWATTSTMLFLSLGLGLAAAWLLLSRKTDENASAATATTTTISSPKIAGPLLDPFNAFNKRVQQKAEQTLTDFPRQLIPPTPPRPAPRSGAIKRGPQPQSVLNAAAAATTANSSGTAVVTGIDEDHSDWFYEAPGDEHAYLPSEVDRRAHILAQPKAACTNNARRNKTAGDIFLRAVLSASGRVRDVEVIHRQRPSNPATAPGDKALDGGQRAAIAAAKRIIYIPALINGAPVSQRIELRYTCQPN